MPCCCSKLVTSTKPCFFRHWFQTAVFFTRKIFQDEPGIQTSSFSGFQHRPRFRVVGSCIRSGGCCLTPGLGNFCRHQEFLHSRYPRFAWLAFGLTVLCCSLLRPSNSSVSRIVLMSYTALRRSWESGIQKPYGPCLLHSCTMSIIGNLLLRGL